MAGGNSSSPQTIPLPISTHSPGVQVFVSHSAVTSATHTPAQKVFSKRRSAVFWKYSRRKGLDKCRFRKRESATSRYRLREKFTDVVVGWRLCFVDEVPPLSSFFEILDLSAGDCRLDENRKPQPYFKCLSRRAGMWRR